MAAESPNPPRPPVPGWLWLVVSLAPFLLLTALCTVSEPVHSEYFRPALTIGMSAGAAASASFTGGLILARRLYRGLSAQIFAAAMLAVLLLAAIAAVVFAGCLCADTIRFNRHYQ